MRRADLRGWLAGTKVSWTARLVFCVLYAHTGKTRRAWPSLPTIAAEAGVARSTVHIAVSELEASGDVVVIRRVGRPNTYLLSTAPPDDPSGSRTGNPTMTRPAPGPHPSDSPRKPVRLPDPKELKELRRSAPASLRRGNGEAGAVDNGGRRTRDASLPPTVAATAVEGLHCETCNRITPVWQLDRAVRCPDCTRSHL